MRTIAPFAFALLAAAACADPTAPRSVPPRHGPTFTVAPGDSIPVPLSAVVLGVVPGAPWYEGVEVVWADVSDREALITARFYPCTTCIYAAQTQGIAPKPGTGTRTDTLYAYTGYRAVELQYTWSLEQATETNAADKYGMSSGLITIDASIATTTRGKRGKK